MHISYVLTPFCALSSDGDKESRNIRVWRRPVNCSNVEITTAAHLVRHFFLLQRKQYFDFPISIDRSRRRHHTTLVSMAVSELDYISDESPSLLALEICKILRQRYSRPQSTSEVGKAKL